MLNEIVVAIKAARRILVAAHEDPDGDAIGSTVAFGLALREMGKEVVLCNVDGVPDILSFLPGSDLVKTTVAPDERFDLGFLLDAGELRRAGFAIDKYCETLINIDHHPHSEYGDIRYVDTGASATAVLIYRLLLACDHPVSLDVAKALYVGLISDTGSFRYSSANREAFTIAGELVDIGVDPWDVASNLYESYPLQRMQLLGRVLATLDVAACGRYASVALLQDDLRQVGAEMELSDSFVNYPRAVKGVEVAVFIRQLQNDIYQFSFRSRGTIDVGSLARSLGGGGHHNAAGAKIEAETLEAARTIAYQHLDRLLS